jgi:REP element-mobilizing transposase RayT
MSRPLRIQFLKALYHVTSRGDRKGMIYRDHVDRAVWLSLLAKVCADYHFIVHGFCQMGNHYHLVIETPDGNLSHGMRQLNGTYAQYFNRRHDLVGHLFQGRYYAVLAQREAYLQELSRYVVLNPVRAQMVASPGEWPWSSYSYILAQDSCPDWLDVGSTLRIFSDNPETAVAAYKRFVIAGIGAPSPLLLARHQLILGDDAFVASLQLPTSADNLRTVAKEQRRAMATSLQEYSAQSPTRNAAMANAYLSNAYTMAQIAAHFGVAIKTVGRAVKKNRAR